MKEKIKKLGFMPTGDQNWLLLQEVLTELSECKGEKEETKKKKK